MGILPLRSSLEQPRCIDQNKVDAVHVRRELDLKLGHAVTLFLGQLVKQFPLSLQDKLLQHQTEASEEIQGKGKGKSKGKGKGKGKGKSTNADNARMNLDNVQINDMGRTLEEEQKDGEPFKPLLSYGPCQTPALLFCVFSMAQRQRAEQAAKTRKRVALKLRSAAGDQFEVLSDALAGDQAQQCVERISACIKDECGGSTSVDVKKMSHDHTTFSMQPTKVAPAFCESKAVVSSLRRSRVDGLQRPLPMNTWTLEQVASALLGMSPSETLNNTQRLYEFGCVSYPRTYSTTYSDDFDVAGRLQFLAYSHFPILKIIDEVPLFRGKGGPKVQDYARRLLMKHEAPRRGLDEGDGHEPIVPDEPRDHESFLRMDDDLRQIYELIVRYFLATLSPDCEVIGHEAEFLVMQQSWRFPGIAVQKSGWMEVLPVAYGQNLGPPVQKLHWLLKATQQALSHCDSDLVRAMDLQLCTMNGEVRSFQVGKDATLGELRQLVVAAFTYGADVQIALLLENTKLRRDSDAKRLSEIGVCNGSKLTIVKERSCRFVMCFCDNAIVWLVGQPEPLRSLPHSRYGHRRVLRFGTPRLEKLC